VADDGADLRGFAPVSFGADSALEDLKITMDPGVRWNDVRRRKRARQLARPSFSQ